MSNNSVSIILPVYNGDSTLKETLNCIKSIEKYFLELIIINDGSSDDSKKIIENFSNNFSTNIIEHKTPKGLAHSYNEAILKSKGEIVLTIHQDILFEKIDFTKIIEPFTDKNVVASSHQVILPLKVWLKFNFWQKLFFARKLDILEQGIDGKFDGFRKSSIIKLGMFNANIFHSAGEDGDMVYRLKKIGKIIQTKALITHIHQNNSKFSLQEIFRKQAQYSQAQGALLRLGHFSNINQIIKTFFREILVLSLLIPYVNIISCLCILIYSITFSFSMFTKTKLTIYHLLIPIINILLLFISLFFSANSFITGKQKI